MNVKIRIQTRSTKCQYSPRDLDQVRLLLRQLASHPANQQHAVVDDAAEDVTAVKAGKDEEGRVEQVDLDRHTFFAEQGDATRTPASRGTRCRREQSTP